MIIKSGKIAGGCYLYGSDAFFAGVLIGKARSIMANSRDAGVTVYDFDAEKGYVRALTPLEYWRFMGFSEKDYQAARAGANDTQLRRQAGNSIVKNVLVAILGEMIPGKENKYKETGGDGD